MSKNKATNYLKYAIGEILLVVIGILFALQINNWNESKKKEKNLQTIINIIQKDLQGDVAKVKEILEFYELRKPYLDRILNNKLTKEDYLDSTFINLITYAPRIAVTTRGYNLLTEITNDNAEKDSLQIALTEFYSVTMSRFDFLKDYVIEDIDNNFSHWKNTFNWYPDYILRRNLDDFIEYSLTDADYKNRVANYYFVHYTVSTGYLEEFLTNANSIIGAIESSND